MSIKITKLGSKHIATMAVLGALSIVLLLLIRFPLFLPFLEYDFADIPIILCTMMFGTGYGLLLTVIVCIIQGILLSSSGIIGVLMHLFATGTFVLVFGLMRSKNKSVKWTIVSAVCGVAAWVSIMIGFNLVLTPVFMGLTTAEIIPYLLPSIIPFNLVKAIGNVSLGVIVYYSVNKFVNLEQFSSTKTSKCDCKK
ncbi:MAG: ECF transporter S component [Bacillota bacterium]